MRTALLPSITDTDTLQFTCGMCWKLANNWTLVRHVSNEVLQGNAVHNTTGVTQV
jgi:hypothetical protein